MNDNRKLSEAEWRQMSVPGTDEHIRNGIELSSGIVRRNLPGVTTYQEYLCIDDLLSAQRPYTDVPDERPFVSTHQKLELAFKDMLADLNHLDVVVNDLIGRISFQGIDGIPPAGSSYWRTPLTATNRLKKIACWQMRALFSMLDFHDEPTFDSAEFARFRTSLIGASGFQSSQFRAIQKALGKENLFHIRLIVLRDELENRWDLVSIDDSRAMQDELPPSCALDDNLHKLLALLADKTQRTSTGLTVSSSLPDSKRITEIESHFQAHMETLKNNIYKDIANGFTDPAIGDDFAFQAFVFGKDFEQSIEDALGKENVRRKHFDKAAAGGEFLFSQLTDSPLTYIIKAIRTIDYALHGHDEEHLSFLSWHLPLIGRRIGEVQAVVKKHNMAPQPAGTGGQGASYLKFVYDDLVPLFPALAALPPGKRTVKEQTFRYVEIV